MPDKKLAFNITATDDVSKVTSKLATNVKKDLKSVDDAMDDSRSAGKRVADALNASFELLDAQLTETASATDALRVALGDAGSGIDAAEAVRELQRIGLSLDEIEADADELAAALKKADDVRLKHFGDEVDNSRRAVDDLGKSAGSSKSVLANMIGNSVQDVGALTGVAGSAGVAIGQMGEYMADARADGDGLSQILRSFSGVAVPIAALALATKTATDIAGRFTASQERSAAAVKVWEDALLSGEDAAAAYSSSLRDLGEVTLDVTRAQSKLENVVAELDSHWYSTGIGVDLLTKAFGASSEETKDMTDELVEAGITLDQWTGFVQGGSEAAATLAAALRQTTLSEEDQSDVLTALTQAQEDHSTAQKNAAVITKFFTDTNEDAVRAYIKTAGAAIRVASTFDGVAESAAEAAEANRRLTDRLFAVAGSSLDAEQAALDMASAYARLEEQTMENVAAQNSAELSDREKAQSARDLRSAELDLAEQAYRTAEAFADQAAQNGDARAKSDLMRDSLVRQAAQYPGLREEIAQYIAVLDRIPATKNTNVVTTYSGARPAGSTAGTGPSARGQEARADGGPVEAGEAYLVGEEGPEIVVPRSAGTVIPNDRIRQATGATFITNHNTFGPGLSVRDVRRLLLEGDRRYGPR